MNTHEEHRNMNVEIDSTDDSSEEPPIIVRPRLAFFQAKIDKIMNSGIPELDEASESVEENPTERYEGSLNWGGRGEEETEEQRREREYQQKFFGLGNDPEFIIQVQNSISPGKQRPEDIVDTFQKNLNAETFQHNIDISIAVRESMRQLINNGIIHCFNRHKQRLPSPLHQDVFIDLIVQNNGFVSSEK